MTLHAVAAPAVIRGLWWDAVERRPARAYVRVDDQSAGMTLNADSDVGTSYRLRTAVAARETGELLTASPYVLSVRLFVPDHSVEDVRAWLDDEHYAAQLGVSGCHWYLGYESIAGTFNFLNLWGLDSPDVIETPEWAAARDTPWRARLMPAFADTRRAVYRTPSSAAPGT